MFLAPMGRFQLELIYYFTYFSTVVREETSTPTRSDETLVLTTKGLQKRNIQMLNGTTVKIGKIIN